MSSPEPHVATAIRRRYEHWQRRAPTAPTQRCVGPTLLETMDVPETPRRRSHRGAVGDIGVANLDIRVAAQRDIRLSFTSAAAAGASAAFADVAGTGGAHLDAAGHAHRGVGRGAGDPSSSSAEECTSPAPRFAVTASSCRPRRPPRDRRRLRERLDLDLRPPRVVGRGGVVGAGLELARALVGGVDAERRRARRRTGSPAPGDGRCSPSPTAPSGCPRRRSGRPARSACW